MRLKLLKIDDTATSATTAAKGRNLLEVLIANKIDISHSCGGNGTCTTCRVFLATELPLSPRSELEKEHAQERGFAPNERLACQCEILSTFGFQVVEEIVDGENG